MSACIYFVFVCGIYDFIEKNASDSFTRALTPDYALARFRQTPEGGVILNGELIDTLAVRSEQLEVFSRDEYYFVSNRTLFHRLSNLSSLALKEDLIDCISFDSFSQNLWWIPADTRDLCSFTGCESVLPEDTNCAALEVTNGVIVLLTLEGALYVDGVRQPGIHSRIGIIPRLKQDLSSYLETLLVMLALVVIYAVCGRARRGQRSHLIPPHSSQSEPHIDCCARAIASSPPPYRSLSFDEIDAEINLPIQAINKDDVPRRSPNSAGYHLSVDGGSPPEWRQPARLREGDRLYPG